MPGLNAFNLISAKNACFCFSAVRCGMILFNLERHLPANPVTALFSDGQHQKSDTASCFSVDILMILL